MVLLLAATAAFTCSNLLPKLPSAIMSGVFFGGVYLYQLLCNRSFKKGGWLIFECMGVFSRDYGISTQCMGYILCMRDTMVARKCTHAAAANTVDYGGYGGP